MLQQSHFQSRPQLTVLLLFKGALSLDSVSSKTHVVGGWVRKIHPFGIDVVPRVSADLGRTESKALAELSCL